MKKKYQKSTKFADAFKLGRKDAKKGLPPTGHPELNVQEWNTYISGFIYKKVQKDLESEEE